MKGDEKRMMPFEEAFDLIMGSARFLGDEEVPLGSAEGRIISGDVLSDIDMPPFDKSAMDGFACRRSDLGSPLEIIETIPAGTLPKRAVGEGQCSRIMTGAAVPEGADIVVKVEDPRESGGVVTVAGMPGKRNICYRGEDIRSGDLVLRSGLAVSPARAAVLAAAGADPVRVARRPVLGIAVTGDELVEPAVKPPPGSIRNSNGVQLAAQARGAGLAQVYMGVAGDTPDDIAGVLRRGEGEVDVWILSGGVSMGDYDHVPGVLEDEGFDLLVEKVAMKPGKPLVFGERGDSWVFGLPGNPVSTFVIFEMVVRPFCRALMGAGPGGRTVAGVMRRRAEGRVSNRLAHMPVTIDEEGGVTPLEYHGSAHIHAYSEADGLIRVPPGAEPPGAGEKVKVYLIGY